MSRYTIKQISNVLEWERFIQAQPYTLFVQSYQYGEFYKSLGESFWIFGVYEGETLIGGSLVVSVHAKRGDFLLLPYGPVFASPDIVKEGTVLSVFFSWLSDFAKKEHYTFIRVSPFNDASSERIDAYTKAGFRSAPMHVLAETTWILDVRAPKEELLSSMNKNHRNLIRRCEREGVVIKTSTDPHSLKSLDTLLNITAERHKFVRFSQSYIEKEFTALARQGNALFYEAFLPDGTLDAAAVIMFYGNMACYRHSASLNAAKQIPTSYALQWAVIEEAKKRGMSYYNFWGIAPEDASTDHPFKGITHFKKGFGGFQKDLLHCHDLPVKATYWINWIIETMRRYRRGF